MQHRATGGLTVPQYPTVLYSLPLLQGGRSREQPGQSQLPYQSLTAYPLAHPCHGEGQAGGRDWGCPQITGHILICPSWLQGKPQQDLPSLKKGNAVHASSPGEWIRKQTVHDRY